MKKLLLLLALLTIVITGCAGLETAESTPEPKPLNPTDWPTPVLVTPLPSPTDFPKLTLEPTATASALASVKTTQTTTNTVTKEAVLAKMAEIGFNLADLPPGMDIDTIVTQMQMMGITLDALPAYAELAKQSMGSQASLGSGQIMPMVATGVIKQPGNVAERQGPGENYAIIMVKDAGDIAGVIGRDASGKWLYVLTSAGYGWLPTSALHFTGDVSGAPVVSAQPRPAAVMPSLAGAKSVTRTGQTAGSGLGVTSPISVTNLKPIAKAVPRGDALNLRQGPGAAYTLLTTLKSQTPLQVLAKNKTADWLLVQTADKQTGWASLGLVKLEGTLADLPIVVSAAPGLSIPAGQIAPLSSASTTTTQPVANSSQASGQPSSPQVVQVNNPVAVSLADTFTGKQTPATTILNESAVVKDLAQIGTARLAQREVDMRWGPGTNYGVMTTLKADDEDFYILAIDESKNWALVKRTFFEDPKTGWVLLSQLKTTSALTNAPQVATAWVESNGIDLRQGPSFEYGVVGKLGQGSLVAVYGLSPQKDWVLLKPVLGGGQGWMARRFLKDVTSANLPLVNVNSSGTEAPSPFAAKTTAPQGLLVFQLSSGGDIMVINADGSGLRRLTHGIDPVLSPDKKQVAFTRWQGESGAVWVINLDGTGERQIVGNIKQAKGPDWSPDSSQIVINFQDGGRLEDKENCFNLTKGSPGMPPRDARHFRTKMRDNVPYFCWTIPPDAHWHLRVIKVADGTSKDVNGGEYAFRPTWHPTQAWRVVADSGSGLQEVNVNENIGRKITTVNGDSSPTFSPDGQYLVAVVGDISGSPGNDIYRLNGDGSGRLRLTKTPLWVTSGPDKQVSWNNVAPAWSPDSALVAFLTDRNGKWEIWVMNSDGSSQRPMFADAINNQLAIEYHFVDERVLSWR